MFEIMMECYEIKDKKSFCEIQEVNINKMEALINRFPGNQYAVDIDEIRLLCKHNIDWERH
jgi:hypothetical protein